MKKYIFPINYDYANKLFGIIDYAILPGISIYGIILIIILALNKISLFLKIGIFLILFLPPTMLLSTSINKEPFYLFLYFVIKHEFTKGKYLPKK